MAGKRIIVIPLSFNRTTFVGRNFDNMFSGICSYNRFIAQCLHRHFYLPGIRAANVICVQNWLNYPEITNANRHLGMRVMRLTCVCVLDHMWEANCQQMARRGYVKHDEHTTFVRRICWQGNACGNWFDMAWESERQQLAAHTPRMAHRGALCDACKNPFSATSCSACFTAHYTAIRAGKSPHLPLIWLVVSHCADEHIIISHCVIQSRHRAYSAHMCGQSMLLLFIKSLTYTF